MGISDGARYLATRGSAFIGRSGELLGARLGSDAVTSHHLRLASRYVAPPIRTHAFVVRVRGRRPHVPDLGWTGVFLDGIATVDVPFDLHGALAPGSAGRVADLVSQRLISPI